MATPTPLKCGKCGATFGALLPVDADNMRRKLSGTFLAGIAGMLPDNIGETVMPALDFECGACFLRRIQHGATEENSSEENDTDAAGEPRQVQRQGIFRRRRPDRRDDNGTGER